MKDSTEMKTSSQMAFFAFLACADFYEKDTAALEKNVADILMSVKEELKFSEISWGPVARKKWYETRSDALAYIVKNENGGPINEYTISIRGTNPFSFSSWVFQDLDVGKLRKWAHQSPRTASKDAAVSRATDRSLGIHKKLASGGNTILKWLLEVLSSAPGGRIKLNVCGHSLGGLMSTTFALYLHDELRGRKLSEKVDLNVYAFAGPTAGNAPFAEYSDSSLGAQYTCYRNPFDIATHVWVESDMTSVLPAIYEPEIGMKAFESDILEHLSGKVAKLGYAQLPRSEAVPSLVVDHIPFRDYLAQAGYQHVVPYVEAVYKDAPDLTKEILLAILKDLFMRHETTSVSGRAVVTTSGDRESQFAFIREKLEK
jgi:hypothetical protein